MTLSAIQTEFSCADDYDPNSLPVSKALEHIDALVSPISGVERVAVRSALQRVLAEPIISPLAVPAHDNSAMDGYAVCSDDLPETGSKELQVIGEQICAQWPQARIAIHHRIGRLLDPRQKLGKGLGRLVGLAGFRVARMQMQDRRAGLGRRHSLVGDLVGRALGKLLPR